MSKFYIVYYMRYFTLILALAAAPFISAQPLQTQVTEQLNMPVLQGAIWGGTAVYTDGKEPPLFAVRADTRLTPASTLKLLTTAAALELLGPHHRFETRLYAQTAPDENGVVNGALYVQGGGDMTLGSPRVPGAQTAKDVLDTWVQAVKKAGITQINGGIVADESMFEGISVAPKVNWENMGNYYAAPVSPLCWNDNLFEVHFKPQLKADAATEIAGTTPQDMDILLENFVTTDGKTKTDNAFIYAAPGQYRMQIFGTIPTTLKGFTIKGALPDPALFAVRQLQAALSAQGIKVNGLARTTAQTPDYTAMTPLHTYKSPELKDIIIIVNKRSFNLYAEMLLRHLAVHAGKKGSLQNGLDELQKFLKTRRIAAPNDTVIYDGSGLSRDNLLTPHVLVNTLRFMTKSPHFTYYYKSLATPDDRGDLLVLRRFLKQKKQVDSVRIKGGTIDNIKALAGYTKDADGKMMAFAFMANNLAGKDESLFRMHENLIKMLLEAHSAKTDAPAAKTAESKQ